MLSRPGSGTNPTPAVGEAEQTGRLDEAAASCSSRSRRESDVSHGSRLSSRLIGFWCHIGTNMAVRKSPKDRVVARVPTHIRDTIEAAASTSGMAVNQFIVQAAYREAQETLARERTIHLTAADAKLVCEMLDHPPKPTPAIKKAFASFKDSVRVRS